MRTILTTPSLVILCAATVGCSWSVVAPRPDYEPARHGPPRCDDAAPVRATFDVIGLGVSAIITGLLLKVANEGLTQGDGRQPGMLLPAAVATVPGIFHIHALHRNSSHTKKCQQAKRRWDDFEARSSFDR